MNWKYHCLFYTIVRTFQTNNERKKKAISWEWSWTRNIYIVNRISLTSFKTLSLSFSLSHSLAQISVKFHGRISILTVSLLVQFKWYLAHCVYVCVYASFRLRYTHCRVQKLLRQNPNKKLKMLIFMWCVPMTRERFHNHSGY